MHRRTLAPFGALALALAVPAVALPAAADAHVRLLPNTAVAGSFSEFDVRVPNEQDRASTTKVKVLFPHGFLFASIEPRPGWKAVTRTRKLATPVQTDDGPIDTEVSSITWTGSGKGSGKIAPGEYMKFPVLTGVPATAAGATLSFPSVQWYSNGDRIRWVGSADAELPAPQVRVSAPATAAASRLMSSPFAGPVARAAHAEVVSRTPASGSTRSTVKQVKVTFAEKIVTGKISLTRSGRTVAAASSGPSSSKKSLVARFSRKLASGRYKASYSYLADDGDRVSGSWSFRVR